MAFPLLALAVVPGLATAVVWAVAILAEDGPLHDSAVIVYGVPAAVSALVVYRLADRYPAVWALASVAATPLWAGFCYVLLVIVSNPD